MVTCADDGLTWLPEMGISNALLKKDVRQCLDGKHNSKLSDAVIIDLSHCF